jgi:mycofactocin system transcriptional regulator
MTEESAGAVTRGRPPVTSRESVGAVALDLFIQRGFEETTMDDIAEALGVGRRTVFRYYASKNDIVWGDFDRVLERIRAELDGHGDDVPVVEAVAAAAVASNRYPAEQLPELRLRLTLITTVPALQAHSMLRYSAWRAVVAEYAARRWGVEPDALEPQALGYAALGASMAAFTAWVRAGGDLGDHLRTAYVALSSGFRPERGEDTVSIPAHRRG